MSGFAEALRAYREGELSRESLLTEVERELAERETDAVSLLKQLNEEHSLHRLPDNLHSTIAARILQWREARPANIAAARTAVVARLTPGDDGSATILIEPEVGNTISEAPPVAAGGSEAGSRRGPAPPVGAGSVLQGRFKLIEPIGQGGMSTVYKAIDLRKVEARSSDPYVAVKILTLPSRDFGHSLAVLQSEAQKLQSLPHPNIVRVIDCDRDGRTVFMTMEHLTGEPLKRTLLAPDFKGLPTQEAERIVEAIASALEFAHRNDIIHGDLKPGNIIMTDKGEVKVIDFGIARLMTRPRAAARGVSDTTGDGVPAAAPSDSQPWLAALTPLYASPEMLEHKGPDPRDDVYALACIAHELLTGQHPFDHRSAIEARDAGIVPVRSPGVSRGQFKAILHGLEFDREQRTPTVEQFLEEFRARRPGPQERVAVIATLGALILLGSLYFALHGRIESRFGGHPGAVAAQLATGEVFRDCPTCPLMKVLPAGRFKQGSAADDPDAQPFEQPQHPVAIGYPFGIGVYEVTVGEFREFVAATGRKLYGCTVYDGAWTQRQDLSWSDVGYPQTSTHPVACVSWRDAREYTQWLSLKTGKHYRLPSASEWEYAARAGSAAPRPWGTNTESACDAANVADESAARRYPGWKVHPCNDGYIYSAPVGLFAPNAFGLYDMLGNVVEWVQDCWHPDYRNAPSDGSAWEDGDCTQYDLRGGSWFTSPQTVSVAARNRFDGSYRSNSIGLRLVREVKR